MGGRSRKPAAFIGRLPDTASSEELRRFQPHLEDTGSGPLTLNATITGLRATPRSSDIGQMCMETLGNRCEGAFSAPRTVLAQSHPRVPHR